MNIPIPEPEERLRRAVRSLNFLPTGRQVSDGAADTVIEGYCDRMEILWTNYVQAYNTKKADGTGREVLCERHRMLFDGVRFWVPGQN